MHNKIITEMSICQAENGFSLDELVKKLADSYEKKAFGEILKMNLLLNQEVLMHRISNGKSNHQCCSDGHLTMNGSFERRIRTSSGEFKMVFWRVRCSKYCVGNVVITLAIINVFHKIWDKTQKKHTKSF